MPFPLLEFIYFGLSSLNSEVYFPMRDLFAPCGADGSYISPGPLQRPGDFFARPRENVAPGPPLRPERPLPTHVFFSNPPDSRSSGPVSPKAPRAPDRFPRPSPVIPACALDRLPPRETQSRSRLPRARHLPARQLFPAIIQQRRHEPVYKRVSFLGVRAPVLETAKPQPSQ